MSAIKNIIIITIITITEQKLKPGYIIKINVIFYYKNPSLIINKLIINMISIVKR